MFANYCLFLNIFRTMLALFHNRVIFELEVNSTTEVLQKYSI